MPFANTELGCCAVERAVGLGRCGGELVEWTVTTPRLKGGYVDDQGVQARENVDLLRANEAAQIDATFVFTFVEPAAGMADDADRATLRSRSFDPDITRHRLVKTLLEGRRGVTYPEMPRVPKESSRAVAVCDARRGGREFGSPDGRPTAVRRGPPGADGPTGRSPARDSGEGPMGRAVRRGISLYPVSPAPGPFRCAT
ncbi:MAG: hypothetical protein ACREC5_00025 [Thermoplasmata archaeon]